MAIIKKFISGGIRTQNVTKPRMSDVNLSKLNNPNTNPNYVPNMQPIPIRSSDKIPPKKVVSPKILKNPGGPKGDRWVFNSPTPKPLNPKQKNARYIPRVKRTL